MTLTILGGFPLWKHWLSKQCNAYETKKKVRLSWNLWLATSALTEKSLRMNVARQHRFTGLCDLQLRYGNAACMDPWNYLK